MCVYGVLISGKQQIHRCYQAQIAFEEPKNASITQPDIKQFNEQGNQVQLAFNNSARNQ